MLVLCLCQRYKTMSEADPSIPCNCTESDESPTARPHSSPSTISPGDPGRSSPDSSKKRRRTDDGQTTPSSDPASTDMPSCSSPASVAAAAAPSTAEAQFTPSHNSHCSSVPQLRPPAQSAESAMGQRTASLPNVRCGVTGGSTHETVGGDSTTAAAANVVERLAGAAETSAREIACSVTPTALSWAIVSLLADGGVPLGSGGAAGGDRIARQGRRGQGHLLPRSREKYPTPVRSRAEGGG